MPFVKVHLPSGLSLQSHQNLADDIRQALVDALEVRPETGHVILYESAQDCRSVHHTRDPGFVFVEVTMYTGRTQPQKDQVLKQVQQAVARHTGLPPSDILLVIMDSDRANWLGGI